MNIKAIDKLATSSEPTVLLVDDEANILLALRRLLHRETFRIVTAGSGREALWCLTHLSNVALIVSDQRMPGMTGTEFLKHSRKSVPDAIRVLLTGCADLTEAADAINQGGISNYFNKPWNDTELLQAIRNAVETYSLQQQSRKLQLKTEELNLELQEWNRNLKNRILQQTAVICQRSEALQKTIRHKQNAYRNFLTSLTSLVEIRGGKTSKHAENVARLSELVARGAGLPEKEIQLISTAAILHDIGKIGTQEHLSIISPDGMTPDDFAEYSKHPARGQLLLDPIEGLRPVGWMIRSHHEKYAGGGFPDGLAGEDIPLGGRIIGYADMIDCIAQQYATNQAEHALQKTDIHIGRSLDPALQTLFHRFTSHVYLNEAGVLTKASDAGEYLIKLEKLKNGMVLSCNLYSTGGLLLLQKGERLDSRRIESLHRYHEQGQLEDLILIKKSGKATARKGVHV